MIPNLDEYKKRWNFKSDASIKPGLDSIESALKILGHPEKSYPIIHVSGTNGKGSTIQLMERMIQAHGFTTGTFTSPAIKDMHDQIQYQSQAVSRKMVDEAFQLLNEKNLSGTLTDFELLTVLAFVVFRKMNPDYVLVETGMGGLLDSTNVVTPIVSVITSIALDHTDFLGDTLESITQHKAGIIKKNVPVVAGKVPEEAFAVIQLIAAKKGVSPLVYGKDFQIVYEEKEVFKGEKIIPLPKRKMKGNHQRINTAVAIEALLVAGIQLKEAIVQEALLNTQLSHRFEEVLPDVFVDGAHNPAAARALRMTIEEVFPDEKVDFVIGMLKRKDIRGTLDELIPVAHSFTFIYFDHPEAATTDMLLENCAHHRKTVTKLEDGSIMLVKDNERRIIVTGSLYLLSMITIKFKE